MTDKRFVGRDTELASIRDRLEKSNCKLILITGAGGIGKTSLLQKIAEEYSVNNQFVVEYFDLAEQPAAMINQAVHLANSLGLENFPEFVRKIQELQTNSDDAPSKDLQKEAVETCIQEVVIYLQTRGKRLLRITDTFEIALKYNLYGDDWARGINEKLRDIPGTVFIAAGRDKLGDMDVIKEITPTLIDSFGKENIFSISLTGFNQFEMDEFFAEFDEHRMIPLEMREKLHLLTDGRPILLSLAVHWLHNNIPLPIMIEKNLSDLRQLVETVSTRKGLLDSFEFELVSRVRQLQTPFDLATLYAAHIDRRIDGRLLSILLDIDDNLADEILKEFLRFSFVKEFIGSKPQKCTLHDEMRILVDKHAWRYLDMTGEERRQISRKAINQYYRPRIIEMKQKKQEILRLNTQTTLLQDVQAKESDWERWLLEAEVLYYWLKISKEDGYAYFDELYYDEEKNKIRDQFLIDELKRAGVFDEDKIAIRDADHLRRRGQTEAARQICSIIRNKKDLSVADRIHVNTILGLIESEISPSDAEQNFKEALELATNTNDLRVQAILHNNLGRLYRNTSRLNESIYHFKQTLDLAKRSSNLEMISTARNNLAWTYRLDGNLVEADSLCRLAIAENRKHGHERPLAYAYLTKADIDRDRGDLQSADRHARQALDIFSRLEDVEGKAQAYRTLANISRYLQNFEQALRYLRTGILLVEKRNSLPLLASLYQLYGRSVRHYATYLKTNKENLLGGTNDQEQPDQFVLFEDALIALQQGIILAEQTHNPWEVARSKIEIALIMMLQPDLCNEDKLKQLLGDVWKAAFELDDELLMGYVLENRARIEMSCGKYLEAGQEFGKAALHIAKRTGQETTRAFDRLHNILLDDPLANEQRDELAKGIIEELSNQDYAKNAALVALFNMCEEILASPI